MMRVLLGAILLTLASAIPSQACKACKMKGGGGGGSAGAGGNFSQGGGEGGGGGGGFQRGPRGGGSGGFHGGGRQGRMGHHESKGTMLGHRLLIHRNDLELTPAQQDKIKAIMRDTKKKANTHKAVIENLKIDIHAGMGTGSTDGSAVKRLVDKKYAEKAKLSKLYVDAQVAFENVLTKEQSNDIRDHRYGLDQRGDDDDGHEHDHEEVEVEIKR